jgi:hypothetical protein
LYQNKLVSHFLFKISLFGIGKIMTAHRVELQDHIVPDLEMRGWDKQLSIDYEGVIGRYVKSLINVYGNHS